MARRLKRSLGRVRKALAVPATQLVGWGYLVLDSPDAAVTAKERMLLLVIALTAVGVYTVPNEPR